MMKASRLLIGALVFGFSACDPGGSDSRSGRSIQGVEFTAEQLKEVRSLSPVPPPPPSLTNAHADDPEAAVLGQMLFFDPKLSETGEVSCATCHDPTQDWTDGKTVSVGLEPVTRNAPTLFNLAHHRWFFWDGRKDSLWSQSLGPIENTREMGGSRIEVYHSIAGDAERRALYTHVFEPFPQLETKTPPAKGYPNPGNPRDPMHQGWLQLSASDQDRINQVFVNVGKAIEAFERKLVSKASPFDAFVASLHPSEPSPANLLSDSAVRGLKLFIDKGQCTLCHSGPHFTDLEFHNIGLDRGKNALDSGRFEGVALVKADPFNGQGNFSDDRSIAANQSLHYLAQKPNNLGEFKTPTLRNVATTPPYMHDGRFASLRDVLEFYSNLDQEPALGHREETLQPLGLTDQELDDLEAFLETLTGAPLPVALLSPPKEPLP